ncbi:GNAT family N-acetyltransferase [Monashia sp. NPDC004114]
MEPVTVEGFAGFWSASAPDAERIRLAPFAEHRIDEVVDLTVARLPHLSAVEARWVFEAGANIEDRTVIEALDPHDKLVGVAVTAHPVFAPAGRSFLRVVVSADHEGHGLGSALRSAALEHVPPGTTMLVSGVYDDEPRSLDVARHWGFTTDEHAIESELSLVDLPQPDLPQGVTLHEAPDFDFDDREAVDAMLLRSQTNPEAEQGWVFDLAKLASFVGEKEAPVCVLARVDGVPAGITTGSVAEGVLTIGYSGIDPQLRGRGLMRLVKQQAHLVAARAGATVSRTHNEELNTGIRHVNAQLGYVVTSGVFRMSAGFPG